MDFIALIERAGLRVLAGRRRVQAALSLGQKVMAYDNDGKVYSIAIGDDTLVVQEQPGLQADDSMIVVVADTPCLEDGRDNCNDSGTGEGQFHGRI